MSTGVDHAHLGPLAGMRVLELAHVMAGPVGGLLLADMGADVIKMERVPDGDESRRTIPPEVNGQSASFMIINRNKRSIAIDLKHEKGKALLLRLVRQSDAIIENFRPGTLERLGCPFSKLQEINPALIYCKITGFGSTGPYANRAGYDLISQGMSGLMSVTGEGDGRPPVKVGVPVGDVTAGILAATGILAAYIERLKTGRGQYIDTSLLEASIIHTYWPAALALATGRSAQPMGSAHPMAAPYQAFPTQDGWINIGAISQANFVRTCEALGRSEMIGDPRFTTNSARMKNRDALIAWMAECTRARTTDYWVSAFEDAGVPAGPVNDINQVLSNPQTKARDMVISVDHAIAGEVKALGLPIKFSNGDGVSRRGAPLYGEHTREVLLQHGYAEEEIANLSAAGVIHALAS